MEEVTPQSLARASSLIGLGARSGAVVVGLSAVRRTRGLALVFVAETISENTRRELAGLQRDGARVFLCRSLEAMTAAMGREDASVVAVRSGPMAEGILARLSPETGAGEG